MKKINMIVAIVTLTLWIIYIFSKDTITQFFLSFGIGWCTARLTIQGFNSEEQP